MRKIYVKRNGNAVPSMKIEDIQLADGHYLIQGMVTHETDAETDGGIWIPVKKDMKVTTTLEVLKAGCKCTLAKVGDFVVVNSITGENFNHLKPQPIIRDYFDDAGLFVIHQDRILAVICPEKAK